MNWPKFPWPWFQKEPTHTRSSLSVDVFGATSKGLVRKQNQDEFFFSRIPPCFMVADGLGGLQDGAVASFLAIQRAVDTLMLAWEQGGWRWHPCFGPQPVPHLNDTPESIVKQVFDRAQSDLTAAVNRSQTVMFMGTTLSLALLDEHRLVFGNVGDSRIYLLRENQLRCLTVDDSEAMVLLLNEEIRPEEYKNHPGRHVLTKRVGGSDPHPARVDATDVQRGDIVLLCTDGLYGMISEEQIRLILLNQARDAKWKAKQLVLVAEHAGGEDNIAVVVAQLA